MATRLIGTDDADPRLPALVVAATQGATAADLAPGNILDSLDATTTWSTPFASGVTVGSGVTTAVYYRLGPLVVANLKFVLGSGGSAITGDITVNLPVTALATYTVTAFGTFYDGAAAIANVVALQTTTTTTLLRAPTASGSYLSGTVASATIPFTWGSGDMILVTLVYLAAPA